MIQPGDMVSVMCGFSPKIRLFDENGSVESSKSYSSLYVERGFSYLVLEVKDGLIRLLTDSGSGWIRRSYLRRSFGP